MTSRWPPSRRIRVDAPVSGLERGASMASAVDAEAHQHEVPAQIQLNQLDNAIARTRNDLLARQHAEGYWVGELEGDTILESEYLLLLAFLGREQTEEARLAANYIRQQQLPEGGWSIYPGGPVEISASVKAYFALKLTGHSPDAEYMIRARQAIHNAGGADRVNSFTRYYLALLGVLSYDQCPAVPPELILIPRWMPFNIYEMSAWSRTIVVPLSLLWAFRPVRRLPAELGIRELFLEAPERLTVSIDPSGTLDDLGRLTHLDWGRLFCWLDGWLKRLERWRIRPLRGLAVRRAADWMKERFANSDGLGAIFPPIIWSVVALKCLGYDDESPEIRAALNELRKLSIREPADASSPHRAHLASERDEGMDHPDCSPDGARTGAEGKEETLRLQPCLSPVWDTAITTLALREAGVPADDPSIRRAVRWLLSKEDRRWGDWSQSRRFARPFAPRPPQPGGWYFEFHNDFYPDVDDTCMVLMALARSLLGDVSVPSESGRNGWTAQLCWDDSSRDFQGGLPFVVTALRRWAPPGTIRTAVRMVGWPEPLKRRMRNGRAATPSLGTGMARMFRRNGSGRRAEVGSPVGDGHQPGASPGWSGPGEPTAVPASPPQRAYQQLEAMQPQLAALRRGLRWLFAMQSRDGGWGAFDADNNRELFTRVPFADHNAMIDPSTVDLTARALELFAALGIAQDQPAVRRAIEFVWRHQEEDGCWYGRWGVNYIYGTWQALLGLTAIGVPCDDPRIRKAAQWLKDKQQPCGGWGESPRTYDDPTLRGQGEPTPSQTAWALMGLIAAGEADSDAVANGVRYLLDTQRSDGTWDESSFTGTGFPRVFYLKYHLYRVYFPLLALARYHRRLSS